MKLLLSLLVTAALVCLVSLTGCQQPPPPAPAGLTAEDKAAIEKTIDAAIEAYKARDVDRHMQYYAADAVWLEYDKHFQGVEEIREKHIKPEVADATVSTYRAADRLVRGQAGIAYVSERNVIEGTEKGKTLRTDSGRASYVLEKQADGAWKFKQLHWSGPMNWAPEKPAGKAGKK